MNHFNFGNHFNEPVWRSRQQILHLNIPVGLRAWLFDSGSLTQRLQHRCNGQFQVHVLHQQWQRPMPNEARCLNMPIARFAFVRHVHLLCNEVPVVFARTVIPPRTLQGPQRRLTKLGQKSLGAVLFADRSMRRTQLEITQMGIKQSLYDLATQHLQNSGENIWGRRSLFHLHHKPLLVSEIFLPNILTL